MAHAIWVISDLPPTDAYVPQALCEKDGQRQLFVFEADTQAEAIAAGKQFLADEAIKFERCAFARGGQVQGDDGYTSVLTLDIVEGALPPVLTVIQPYSTSDGFSLMGDEVLATEGVLLPPVEQPEISRLLRAGAAEHPRAAEFWPRLDSRRLARPSPFD